MAWQPIETAPKDGTWILLTEVLEGQMITGHPFILYWDDRWGWGDIYGKRDVNPTHWMPLPDPPVRK